MLGASIPLPWGLGCGCSVGSRGGVGNVISIKLPGLQHVEANHTTCGLLEGLAGGGHGGGAILAVGGINSLAIFL